MKVEIQNEDTVNAYGVSWGHYVKEKIPLTTTLGTDSLGSCFAFIRIDKKEGTVIFAHVSSDGETQTLLDENFSCSSIFTLMNEEINYIYVKGKEPSDNTNKWIKNLKDKYGGEVYHKLTYGGVALSPFEISDSKIVITHCKMINESNSIEYKAKTEQAQKWGSNQGLGSMV